MGRLMKTDIPNKKLWSGWIREKTIINDEWFKELEDMIEEGLF